MSASREPDHVVSTRKHETKFSSDENALKTLATPVPVALVWREGYVKNEVKKAGKILIVIIIKSVELNYSSNFVLESFSPGEILIV